MKIFTTYLIHLLLELCSYNYLIVNHIKYSISNNYKVGSYLYTVVVISKLKFYDNIFNPK